MSVVGGSNVTSPDREDHGWPAAGLSQLLGASGGGSLARWRRAVEDVVADGGPAMHLQPIVDFASARVAGYEALARFGGAPASPDRWFNRAHQVGLGAELEAAALRRALARRGELAAHQFLTINLSPAALADPAIHDVLREHAPLHGIVVELTEHDPMSDRVTLDLAFQLVRDLGALVAIDDIGTGYAGLEWVLTVRPEMVKLDREFIRGVDVDEARATFVRFVGDLVDRLDTWLIAEGIETDGELDAVVALGVPLGQGYRLGHPATRPIELGPDVTARINRSRRSFSAPASEVAAHIEHLPTCSSATSSVAARAVVVDEFHRPLAILDGEAPPAESLMRVKATDAVATVVLRALARPDGRRWDPIVITDHEGRYGGIVRMERLVRALTDTRSNEA